MCKHLWVKNYEGSGKYFAVCIKCNRVESEQVAMLYNFATGLGISNQIVDTFSDYKPIGV